MNISINIRKYYNPIQPTIRQTVEGVSYIEFLPNIEIQNYIYCYWQLKTEEILDEQFNYRVVADGCIDIFFELNNPQENFVMGFCEKFTEFPLPKSFNYFGIRFLPTIFSQLFKVNASELSNRFEHLENIVPNISSFIKSNIINNLDLYKLTTIFDKYFLGIVQHTKFDNDQRFYNALQIILEKYGVLNVETELNTGISTRQLRRLFDFYIGASPKTFSKVIRFQNILRAKPSSQSLRQNKLFFDIGYYDQAHFIKEFKKLYGVTPNKAFGR